MAPPKFADIEKKGNDLLTKDLKPSYGLKIKRTCADPVSAAFTTETTVNQNPKLKGQFDVLGKITGEKYKVPTVKGLTIDKVIFANGVPEISLQRTKPLDTTLDLSYMPEGAAGVKLLWKNKFANLGEPMNGFSSGVGFEYSTSSLFGTAMLTMAKKETPVKTDDPKNPGKKVNKQEGPEDAKYTVKTRAEDYTPSLDVSLSTSPTQEITGGLELKGVDLEKMTAKLTCKGSYTSGALWSAVVLQNNLVDNFKFGPDPTWSVLGAFKQSNEMSFGAKFGKCDDKGTKVKEISGSAQYTPTKETTMRFAATYNLTKGNTPTIQTGVSHAFTKGCTLISSIGSNAKGEPVFGLQVNLES